MADQNQNPQIKTIDDLVNEISKPSQDQSPTQEPRSAPTSSTLPFSSPKPAPSTSSGQAPSTGSTHSIDSGQASSPQAGSGQVGSRPIVTPPASQTPTPARQPVNTSSPLQQSSTPPIQPTPPLTSTIKPPISSPPVPTETVLPGGQSTQYQSTIRTMKDDLSRIKSGDSAALQTQTRTTTLPPSTGSGQAPSTGSTHSIDSLDSARDKSGQAGSGQVAQKGATNPTLSPQFKPPVPKPFVSSTFNQSSTPPILPGRLTTPSPIPSQSKPVDSQPTVRVPSADLSTPSVIRPSLLGRLSLGFAGNSRLALYGLIGLLAIGIGYGIFVLVQNSEPEIEIATFTPRPSRTTQPSNVSLNAVFSGLSKFSVNPGQSTDIISAFHQLSRAESLASGQFRIAQFTVPAPQASPEPAFISLLKMLSVSHPSALASALGNDYTVLIYGQRELFGQNGEAIPNLAQEKRYVFLVEVTDQNGLAAALSSWNPTITKDLSRLLQISNPSSGSASFSQNQFRGVVLSYRNFPRPDKSLDIATVPVGATETKNYLLIANSREAAFATIGRLRDFTSQ